MGRCKNYNTVAPETRHKETKRKKHKTNNHFTIGKSILQSNMDEEAARLLSFLHDKKGTYIWVCTVCIL
jgi:rubrerythrin